MNGLTTGFWLASGACASCGNPVSLKVFTPGPHAVACDACQATTLMPAEFQPPAITGRLPFGKREDKPE